jgi:hypothetical protein
MRIIQCECRSLKQTFHVSKTTINKHLWTKKDIWNQRLSTVITRFYFKFFWIFQLKTVNFSSKHLITFYDSNQHVFQEPRSSFRSELQFTFLTKWISTRASLSPKLSPHLRKSNFIQLRIYLKYNIEGLIIEHSSSSKIIFLLRF